MLDNLLSQPEAYGIPALLGSLAWALGKVADRRAGVQRSLEHFSPVRALEFGSYYLLRKVNETEIGWVFEAWPGDIIDETWLSQAQPLEGRTLSKRMTAEMQGWPTRYRRRVRVFRTEAWTQIRPEVERYAQLSNPGLAVLDWGEHQGLGFVVQPLFEEVPYCSDHMQSSAKVEPGLWFYGLASQLKTLLEAQSHGMTCHHFGVENVVWLDGRMLVVSFDFGLPNQGRATARRGTLQQKLSALARFSLRLPSAEAEQVLRAMSLTCSPYPNIRAALEALMAACALTYEQKSLVDQILAV